MGGVAKWCRSVGCVVRKYGKRRHRNHPWERVRIPTPNFVARRNKREWKRACYFFRLFLGIAFFILVLSWVQSLYDAGSLSHSVETGCQGGADAYQHEGSHAVFSQAQDGSRCLRPGKLHSTQFGSGESVFDTVKHTHFATNRKLLQTTNVESLYDVGSISQSVETRCQGGAGAYQHEGAHAAGQSLYNVGSISDHSVETGCPSDAGAYQHEGAHAVFPQAQDGSRYLHPPKLLSRQIGSGKSVYGTVDHLVILDNISSQRSVYTERKELVDKALEVGTLYSRMRVVSEKRNEIGVPVFYGNRSHSLVTRASDSGCTGKKTRPVFVSAGSICIHLCLDFHAVK